MAQGSEETAKGADFGTTGFFTAKGAFFLTRGMGRTVGVDLTEAVVDGWLTRPELAQMVDRCLTCDEGRECLAWLSRTREGRAVPGFCANKQAIEALRAGL